MRITHAMSVNKQRMPVKKVDTCLLVFDCKAESLAFWVSSHAESLGMKENHQNSYVCFWWGFGSVNVLAISRNDRCRS